MKPVNLCKVGDQVAGHPALTRIAVIAGLSLAAIASVPAGERDDRELNWPEWRGPLGTGVAPKADPPLSWNEESNVRWRVALPGRGHSTPVVWGDKIYLTAAVPYGPALEPKPETAPGAHDNLPVTHRHESVVVAVSRAKRDIVWQKTVHRGLPHEGGHTTGSLASASPITDGTHVYAFFGSRGLYCLDPAGEIVWEKHFGEMQTKHAHGEGSSPVLYRNTIVVNWDHEGQSFVTALDKETGDPRWRIDRDEVTSWASPIVVEHAGKPQLIVSGTGRVRGYDLTSGGVIWECGGLSHNVVASPVAGNGMVFAASSYDRQAMLAIRLTGAKGDVTGTKNLVWRRVQRTPYVPSPLLYDDALYFLRHYQGILSRVDAKSGEERHGPIRLPRIRNVYASPVGAAGRIYITDRDGTTVVMSHDDERKLLAINQLRDTFSASMAIVGKEIFLRGEAQLYCIAED